MNQTQVANTIATVHEKYLEIRYTIWMVIFILLSFFFHAYNGVISSILKIEDVKLYCQCPRQMS